MNKAKSTAFPVSERAFIAVAGTILMVILLGGSIAAFGLFYAAEQQAEDQERLETTFRSADAVSSAEVGFKRQVQEWKNILLRGESTEDYAYYREAFNRDGEHVDHLLQGLLESSDEKQKSAINGLLTEHTQLSARYRVFLDGDHISQSRAKEIDHLVLGIDRPFTERLDKLAAELRDQLKTMRQASREADLKRYQNLKRLNMAVTSLGALLVFALLLWFRPRTSH